LEFAQIAFGIQKLQITCVVEDDKVGTDDLDEKITGFEDYVSCPVTKARGIDTKTNLN